MRVVSIAVVFLALTAVELSARDVHVFIAPRTSSIPASGKVHFDIYWLNKGRRPAAIPAARRHSFTYSPLGPTAATATAVGISILTASHPSADRRIAAGAVIHDSAAIDVDARGVDLVKITAEFRGDRSTFKSNPVVLRTPRR